MEFSMCSLDTASDNCIFRAFTLTGNGDIWGFQHEQSRRWLGLNMFGSVKVQGEALRSYEQFALDSGRDWTTLYSFACFLGMTAAAAAAGSAATSIPFNGWYHCEMNSIDYNMYVHATASSKALHRHVPFLNVAPSLTHTSHAHGRALNSYTNYECGEFQMPMCHEEVCHDVRNKTIDVFVKRKLANPAKVAEIGKEKVLWVMQGGPGDSSTAMEQLMSSLYWEMNETVSIYTMDHRGTGRSNRLVCNAAEAMTSGSAGGLGITADEYPACIQDLLFQMDNHTNAFSVTSAAYDMKKVIEATQTSNATQVFVYALSYGTFLVERLMQLASPAVRGYIVDSVVSQSAADFGHMATFSNWDKDVAVVGARFLDVCSADAFCSNKFSNANVSQVTWALYESLDEAARGSNTCADMINDLGVGPPSDSLRSLFGTLLCKLVVFRWGVRSSSEDSVLYYSELLYGLIVYSEMWEHPTPSYDALYQTFRRGIMGGDTYALGGNTCGVKVLASYVVQDGVLDAVDTSCIADIAPVRFDGVGSSYPLAYFGTADVFDGHTAHYAYVQEAAHKVGTAAHEVAWAVAVGVLGAAVGVAMAVAIRASVHVRRLQLKCKNDVRTEPMGSVRVVPPPRIVVDMNDDDEDRTPGTPPDPVVV
ncbi:hypothetical protein DYB37_006011 [Aphanomyces astaci]|uniref:AB hydrolase-1 domain-containing protein n=1 Tax=Aphanomyces astaci TaxID=112090 RepID=A0A418ERY1_APHAT|nr:hypothetical protein DYB37_006011 [Aphanomyces astaci]